MPRSMPRSEPPAVLRYGAAMAAVAAAGAAASLLQQVGGNAPVVSLLLCGVLFAAWLGGLGSGVLAAVLSVLVFDYFFLPPLYSLAVHDYNDAVRLITFAAAAAFVVALSAKQTTMAGELERTNALLRDENAERQRAEAALRENEKSLQTIIDTIPTLVVRYRPDGSPDFVNQTLRDFVGPGVGPDEMRDAVHPDDDPQRLRDWRAHIAAGEPYENEMRLRRADGVYCWHRIRRVPLRDANGAIVNWYGAGHDIDEAKKVEDRLRLSETYLAEAERLSHCGVTAYKGKTVFYGSEEIYRIWGFDPAQGVPPRKEVLQRIHPDDRDRLNAEVERALSEKRSYSTAYKIVLPDGTVKHIESVGQPVFSTNGDLIEVVAAQIDVTERKRAEEALRKSEAELIEAKRELQAMIDTIPAMVASYDAKGSLTYVNKTALDYTGVPEVEGMSDRQRMLIHPDELDQTRSQWRASVTTGEPFQTELRLRRRDGEYRWISTRRVPLRDSSGQVVKWYGAAFDIEERKRAERALRESEAKTRRLVDANIIGIFIWDSEGGIVEANDAFLRIVNYTREDLVSGRIRRTELTPPEWLDDNKRRLAELKAAGTVQPFEKEYFRKDGSRVPVLIGSAAFDPALNQGVAFDESVNQGVAFVIDVTERKRAELALREREAQLVQSRRELLETIDTIPIPVGRYSVEEVSGNTRRDFVNAAWKQYTGLSDEAAVGSEWSIVIDPDQIAPIEKMWREALAKGEPLHTEERVRRFDGQYRWFAIDRVAVRDENGKVIRWYGTAYDIEDRKQAEDALRRSEAYLAEAQRLSRTGSFGWRISDNVVIWSRETYRIFELDPAVEPTVELVLGRTHPDDIELVRGMIERMANEDRELDFEHRLLLSDGTIKHLHVRTRRGRFEDGEVEIFGALMDVTAARKAEDALRRSQAELAHAARVATLGELSASIVHEVNQPISSIVASGQAAIRWLDRDVPEKERAHLSIVRLLDEAERASQVIRRIRELAKKAEPEMAQVDINGLVEDVAALVYREAVGQRVAVRTLLAPELPPARGDRIQLQQVLINLVINGIQAMASVTDRARVMVISTQRHGDDELLVAVEDAGGGIAPENLARLFNAFYTTKPDGMGMGLSISRSIVEAHGGRVWATCNSGPGTTFQFTLLAYREQTAA